MASRRLSKAEWRQCLHASAALLFFAGDEKEIKNVTLMRMIMDVTGEAVPSSTFHRHMKGVRQMRGDGRGLGEVLAAIEEIFCSKSPSSSQSSAAAISISRNIGQADVDCSNRDNLAGRRAPKAMHKAAAAAASKPATTSVACAAVADPPLADIGNLPAGGGTRSNASGTPRRGDLYRCVHSYFRWRATTAAAWKLPSPSDSDRRHRRGDGRMRRLDDVAASGRPRDRRAARGPGVAVGAGAGAGSSPTDGLDPMRAETATAAAVADRGGADEAGRRDGSTSAGDVDDGRGNGTGGRDGGDGEECDADVEVRMCRRIVSALEEALPQLGDYSSDSQPSPALAVAPARAEAPAARDDVDAGLTTAHCGGTDEGSDGAVGMDRRRSAGPAALGVEASGKTREGGGGGVGGRTRKVETAAPSPAMIKGNGPLDESPEEGGDRRGETDGSGRSGEKEARPHHQSASAAAYAPTLGPVTTGTTATTMAASAPSRQSTGRRHDDNPHPSQRQGPNAPSPELEIRYNAYPDHRRQIFELRARVHHPQLEVHPPQPQPRHRHPQQSPFPHPPWPAPTTPWQQPQQLQHPEAQFYYYYPNHQQTAARFAAGGEGGGVSHPRQADGPAGPMMMMMQPIAGPGPGPRGGPVPIAPAPTCVAPDPGRGPAAKVGINRSGTGRGRTGRGRERVASGKRGAATEEDGGGSSDDDDDDDDDDGSLTKMSDSDGESEDGSAEQVDDDDSSDSDSGSSEAETETESEDDNGDCDCDGDGHEEAPVEEETKTAVATATSENVEATVRRKNPTSRVRATTPSPRTGKKKRKIDLEVGAADAAAGHVNTTTTPPDAGVVEAATGTSTATATAAAVATVSDEAAPGASSVPKRRKPSAAAAAMWETRFLELVEFQSDHGHCRVPCNYKANPALGHWVMRLRRLYAKHWGKEGGEALESNRLSREKMDRLNGLGFTWRIIPEGHPKPFEFRFEELVAFKDRVGHTRVPRRYKNNWQLGEWVKMQRTLYRKGKLSDDRIQKLNEIGFEWNIVKYTSMEWEGRFEQLLLFRLKHGHCDVTPENAMAMAAEDVKVGGQVDMHDATENHGAEVAQSSVGDKAFYSWSERQRQEYRKFQNGRKSKLDGRKIGKLDQIGFDWMFSHTDDSKKRLRNKNVSWEKRVQQLCNFKLTHGHVKVPLSHEEDDSLGAWAGQMRQIYRKHMQGNTASKETQRRFEELKKIGFCLNPGAIVNPNRAAPKPWNERYEELLEFLEEKGHTRVPQNYAGNPTLAYWVATQRKEMKRRQHGKKSYLKDDQIRLLNEIGFEWRVIFSSKKNTSHS